VLLSPVVRLFEKEMRLLRRISPMKMLRRRMSWTSHGRVVHQHSSMRRSILHHRIAIVIGERRRGKVWRVVSNVWLLLIIRRGIASVWIKNDSRWTVNSCRVMERDHHWLVSVLRLSQEMRIQTLFRPVSL
jgi:hypothetical protein